MSRELARRLLVRSTMGTMRRIAPAVFLVALACNPSAPPAWEIVAADLPDAVLSISGTSSSDVWAVGADHGSGPIVLHWDGSAWSRAATATRGTLWWVHAFADSTLYLAGASSTILTGSSHGGTFTRMPTPGLGAQTVFGVWGSAPNDAYAVGSTAGRDGFVWHYDGSAWTDVPLPSNLPADALGDTPGLFKVWGDGAGHVYVVGGRGVILRRTGTGPFVLLPTSSTATLFTVSGDSTRAIVVGGLSNGVVLEIPHDGMPTDVTPPMCALVQGMSVRDGAAFASGVAGTLLTRGASGWSTIDTGLMLDVASLHATWIDPSGGVWSVGGNVLTVDLDHGAIVHRGAHVPRYLPSIPIDGGVLDGTVPTAMCPAAQVDPVPTGSIARRWSEQLIGAIRRDIPRPGVHARNLFHVSAAIWDAWATYDAVADGVFFTERNMAADVVAARREAISYAAYRLLTHRYRPQIGGAVSAACFDALMSTLGYDPTLTDATGTSPHAIGNRIAAAIIATTMNDGANEAMNYADTTMWTATNPPLFVEQPGTMLRDRNHWQPLDLALAETQNGIVTMAGVQTYIGAQWGLVTPFAMTRSAPGAVYHDPGPPPMFGTSAMADAIADLLHRSTTLDTTDGATIDISPGALGNDALGTDDGHGRATNPATSAPYAPNVVPRGDFARVLAEFWADGPRSETPPGHWFVIANTVSDAPTCDHRFEGAGSALDRLEWDARLYLAIAGAVHDAAITAWEIKRRDTSIRPISIVRAMGALGQSSDPAMPHYDPNGLRLVSGEVELISAESSAPGQRHEHLAHCVGQVAVRSWRGEPGDRTASVGGVAWIRAIDWIPYQRRTFVTPAFPGFISGHSTFSRAAAEVLVSFTGNAFFPGGLGSFRATANHYLVFEQGPSVDVELQWATYYDAADQAGQSRIYGGIHITPDDYAGRRIGSQIGHDAYAHARTFFDGTAR